MNDLNNQSEIKINIQTVIIELNNVDIKVYKNECKFRHLKKKMKNIIYQLSDQVAGFIFVFILKN